MVINNFVDYSPPSYTLNYMDMLYLVRLNTTKEIELSPAFSSRRDAEMEKLKAENMDKGTEYSNS